MPENELQGTAFTRMSAPRRIRALEAARREIAASREVLAAMLISHAAALLLAQYPTLEQIRMSVTGCASDSDTVWIERLIDVTGKDLEIAGDFELVPEAVGGAEQALGEASDLGATFLPGPEGGGLAMLWMCDAASGVKLLGGR